jgi:hypothetical protein
VKFTAAIRAPTIAIVSLINLQSIFIRKLVHQRRHRRVKVLWLPVVVCEEGITNFEKAPIAQVQLRLPLQAPIVQNRIVPHELSSWDLLMESLPQVPEPLHQDCCVLNLNLEVHQVALKPVVFADSDQLLSVKSIWGRLSTLLKVDAGHDLAVEHHLALFADTVPVAPLLEDQRAEHFDIVLVRYVNPSWWRDRHSVVTEVDEHVYAVPVNEAVRI